MQPPWAQIIPLIPVNDHSVTVYAVTWQQHLNNSKLQNHHQAIFGGNPQARLSRIRLLTYAYPNPEQKCLEIFMWGWPNRNRGNLRSAFLQNLPAIAAAAAQNLLWPDYYKQLHNLGSLGISTITKLAYFHARQFENLPSLILDARIIDVLASGRWQGLALAGITYKNAQVNYLAYLQTLSKVATQLGCTSDQIEFLLFSWGDAFYCSPE
jgi:hypothetical protein